MPTDDPERPPEPIPGTVPDLADPPPGGPFAPRCPNAGAPCVQTIPPLLPASDGEPGPSGVDSGEHLAACYFPVKS